MLSQPLPTGHVLPLSRRLGACPDPLALFSHLTDGGRVPDTLLLESADTTTARGQRSMLLLDAAVRVEARGSEVRLIPLRPAGTDTIEYLSSQLDGDRVIRRDHGSTTIEVDLPRGESSETARLRGSSCFDVLRCLATSWTIRSTPVPSPLRVAGVFAYDLIDHVETLPRPREDRLNFPDLVFWLPTTAVVIDHQQRSATIIALVIGGDQASQCYADAQNAIERLAELCEQGAADPPERGELARIGDLVTDMSDSDYAAAVTRLKHRIVAGDVFQIVPSRTFSLPCRDPLASYARLRNRNPSPYMYYVHIGQHVLFGSSPETCVKVSGDPRRVEIRPIAGTRRRGRTATDELDPDQDARLEAELRLDSKEVAEHMMLVDLARNDVARVAVPGSRRVSRLLNVDRYSEVMHLVSHVEGQLKPELDALHAYAASMNMGTLVGAPKIKAAEILRHEEPTKRGPYGGAVGYLTCDGEMDTAIVIRSATVTDGVAHVRAGAGVVVDSNPEAEAAETSSKARAVLRALTENDP